MGGETTHKQTLDDMWMSTLFKDTCFNTLSHAVHVNKDEMCARKMRCVRVFCSHHNNSLRDFRNFDVVLACRPSVQRLVPRTRSTWACSTSNGML